MSSYKSLFALGGALVGIFGMALIYNGSSTSNRSQLHGPAPSAQALPQTSKLSPVYGKPEPPVGLSVSLAELVTPGDPVTILVSASSVVPVRPGTITLRIPGIEGEPEKTQYLWSRTSADILDEKIQYTVGILPVGTYCFVAVLEYTLDGGGVETLAVSDSLYLDVRAGTILSSNVSFDHIRRLELRQELERRALRSLRPRSRGTDTKTMAVELARLEEEEPGVVERKVAELQATDPDVARRIMELNQIETEDCRDVRSDTGEISSLPSLPARGQSVVEEAVPVREAGE